MDQAQDEAGLQALLTTLQEKGCTVTRSGPLVSITAPDGRRFQSGDQPSAGGDATWGPVREAAAHLGVDVAAER